MNSCFKNAVIFPRSKLRQTWRERLNSVDVDSMLDGECGALTVVSLESNIPHPKPVLWILITRSSGTGKKLGSTAASWYTASWYTESKSGKHM